MKSFKWLTISLVIATLLLFGFLIFRYFILNSKNEIPTRDFHEIKKTAVLNVVMSTNPIDYFIYQGQPMGFQLEMLEAFAKTHNIELNIIVENDQEKGIEMLLANKCDILAQSVINSHERDLIYDFSIPVRQTKLVLVQQKNKNDTLKSEPIRNLIDLKSKNIFAQKNSISKSSAQNLAYNIIQNFTLTELDTVSQEQIVKLVSTGVFEFAICDYNIAKIAQSYYPDVDIETEISLPQNISWGIRSESQVLLDSINVWLDVFLKSDEYQRLIRKYINNNRILVDINSEFYSGNEGKISAYDDLFKKHSKHAGWDWRLLASLAYEESRFNPTIQSWAGAIGLMQLMPVILAKYSNPELEGTENEIYASAKYIAFLYTNLPTENTDSTSNIKFILAAYNIGFGHIDDAMKLAEKYNKDKRSWDDVSYFLINLANPKYYNDSLVRHGYFPGVYAVDFANSIVNRYKHYLNVIPE
jgi:membrane-bound lytic murein transglycosylase F